jgi:hypothetical protein
MMRVTMRGSTNSAVAVLISRESKKIDSDRCDSGLELPVCDQLDAVEHSGDPVHGAFLAG